jgi:hypothetical protein
MFIKENRTNPNEIYLARINAAYFIFLDVAFCVQVDNSPTIIANK